MGVSNGKITAPVSIGDVSTALGVGNYDLGYLCKNTHRKTVLVVGHVTTLSEGGEDGTL